MDNMYMVHLIQQPTQKQMTLKFRLGMDLKFGIYLRTDKKRLDWVAAYKEKVQ
jgi:hypothetical protein